MPNKANLSVKGDTGGPLHAVELQVFHELDEAERQLMRTAAAQMGLSVRAYHRVLKLAHTIADLAGEDGVQTWPGCCNIGLGNRFEGTGNDTR